jgi:outer membrane protein assembly factor BamA
MRGLVGILCCMSVASSAWNAQSVTGSRFSAILSEGAQQSSASVAVLDWPEKSYRIQGVVFEGGKSFSQEQLADAFHVQVGGELNHIAIGHGLERLRQLYSANGYFNFTAAPMLQVENDRNTVVLTISIDDGEQFNFGQLFLAGDETWMGEANALRRAWAPLSGKRFNGQVLSKWLFENAMFLPNDEKSRQQFVEQHVDDTTHRVDIQLTFP